MFSRMPRSTLLVIDDEPNILTSLRRALELEGYGVEVAGSGSVGLAKLDERDIDMVLLDVMMPGMGGLEVLARAREKHPDVSVVMMSGNATIETAVKATKLGAYDFVEKPLSTDKLLLTVQNTLAYAGLRRENARLAAQTGGGDFAMVGSGAAMRGIFDKISKTAPSSGRVLITGDNGTGKELVARAIHDHSKRAAGAFIKLNCAAIPAELIESELFGHEKGAFTGATQQRRGTLFRDEVGDMNPGAQAKVLRVLQEGEFERVGGDQTIKTDVRVIAATNKNLAEEIAGGRFREDLYYRLNVVPIELAPLRERREDVPGLIDHFLAYVCRVDQRREKRMAPGAVTMLMQYDWPGNVRELKNLVERLVILTGDNQVIGEADVQDALPGVKPARGSYRRGLALKDLVAAA